MLRVAVLVSGGGTNLQALIDAQKNDQLGNCEIALVVSNRKAAYALQRATQNGIKTQVHSKFNEPNAELYDEKLANILVENNIDFVVLAGFLGIIGQQVLQNYSNKIINIHPALIPSFCGKGYYGLKVHEAVLARGVKVTGATAHLVTAGVDEGPILLQQAVDVLEDDTPESLQQRVMQQAEWRLLPRAVKMMCERLESEGEK